MNLYRVYGLKIQSEIEMKELLTLNDKKKESCDVKLFYGVVSDKIKSDIKAKKKINLSKEDIWFHIEGVATYWIKSGTEVIVDPCENADLHMLKTYLMCSCLGFIMLQREMVAIHGGTVVFDEKAVIFTGDRGAGKSTLTIALRLKGYSFISDDVASTSLNNGPIISPGFPYQKLCEDTMDNMKINKSECTSFMSDTKIKYLVPAHDNFIDADIRLAAICELTVGDVDEVEIQELKGKEKLTKLIKNIYRGEYIKGLGGMTPKYFKQCIDIAKHIKFYKIIRPENQFTVDEQINLIETEVVNNKEDILMNV
ncbi:MAG: hypothetical protein RSD47_08855 [Romboutsia sp.]